MPGSWWKLTGICLIGIWGCGPVSRNPASSPKVEDLDRKQTMESMQRQMEEQMTPKPRQNSESSPKPD